MRSGDTVKIFEDPVTRRQFEGLAILKKFVSKEPPFGERWRVTFIGDEGTVYRLVNYVDEPQ
jgi:hypothetical protein